MKILNLGCGNRIIDFDNTKMIVENFNAKEQFKTLMNGEMYFGDVNSNENN